MSTHPCRSWIVALGLTLVMSQTFAQVDPPGGFRMGRRASHTAATPTPLPGRLFGNLHPASCHRVSDTGYRKIMQRFRRPSMPATMVTRSWCPRESTSRKYGTGGKPSSLAVCTLSIATRPISPKPSSMAVVRRRRTAVRWSISSTERTRPPSCADSRSREVQGLATDIPILPVHIGSGQAEGYSVMEPEPALSVTISPATG
jgi:hypothetical protein